MPRPTLTTRSVPPRMPRPERRAEIVRVAYQLIATRGLEGLRFADVARAAGINNGTLLYYFVSKDALIEAVGACLVDEYKQSAAPRSDDQPLSALDELRWEFIDAATHLDDSASVVYLELLARAQRDASVAALLQTIDASWRGWLTSILTRGQAQGLFRADLDIDLVTTTLMATIRGVGLQALVARDAAALEAAMRAIGGLIETWVTPAAQPG